MKHLGSNVHSVMLVLRVQRMTELRLVRDFTPYFVYMSLDERSGWSMIQIWYCWIFNYFGKIETEISYERYWYY